MAQSIIKDILSKLNAFMNMRNMLTTCVASSAVALATSDKNAALSIRTGNVSAYSVSSGGIKVPSTGVYQISAMWGFNNLGTGANTLTCSIKNGSTMLDAVGVTHTGGYHVVTYMPRCFNLTANSVVYLAARNNSGDIGNLTWAQMTIEKISNNI